MAGPLHRYLLPIILLAICSVCFSQASPPFHENDKPAPGAHPSPTTLPPPLDKPSPEIPKPHPQPQKPFPPPLHKPPFEKKPAIQDAHYPSPKPQPPIIPKQHKPSPPPLHKPPFEKKSLIEDGHNPSPKPQPPIIPRPPHYANEYPNAPHDPIHKSSSSVEKPGSSVPISNGHPQPVDKSPPKPIVKPPPKQGHIRSPPPRPIH